MLAWLAPGPLKTLGSRALSLVSNRWFHGELSVGAAEAQLSEQDTGTYLVRFSTVLIGGYCLSYVDKEEEVHHVRILHPPGLAQFKIGNDSFDSLDAAVTHLVVLHSLTRPCPGSFFSMFWSRSPRLSIENRAASPYRP